MVCSEILHFCWSSLFLRKYFTVSKARHPRIEKDPQLRSFRLRRGFNSGEELLSWRSSRVDGSNYWAFCVKNRHPPYTRWSFQILLILHNPQIFSCSRRHFINHRWLGHTVQDVRVFIWGIAAWCVIHRNRTHALNGFSFFGKNFEIGEWWRSLMVRTMDASKIFCQLLWERTRSDRLGIVYKKPSREGCWIIDNWFRTASYMFLLYSVFDPPLIDRSISIGSFTYILPCWPNPSPFEVFVAGQNTHQWSSWNPTGWDNLLDVDFGLWSPWGQRGISIPPEDNSKSWYFKQFPQFKVFTLVVEIARLNALTQGILSCQWIPTVCTRISQPSHYSSTKAFEFPLHVVFKTLEVTKSSSMACIRGQMTWWRCPKGQNSTVDHWPIPQSI